MHFNCKVNWAAIRDARCESHVQLPHEAARRKEFNAGPADLCNHAFRLSPKSWNSKQREKKKTNKNRMPSQEKQISVDVSNENKVKKKNKKNNNVGPSLLYLQAYQQRVRDENELERYLRCRGGRAWEIMERKHSAELLGTKQKGAWRGGRVTVRVKKVRWGRAGEGRRGNRILGQQEVVEVVMCVLLIFGGFLKLWVC